MKKTCIGIDGDCGRPAHSRGLCSAHYQRARAAGILDEIAPNPSGDCKQCGKPIPGGRRWGAEFCSIDCKQVWTDAHRDRKRTERRKIQGRLCAWCREILDAERRSGTRFCTRECKDAWKNNQRRLAMLGARAARRGPCEACGGPVPAERPSNAIYCSPECKRRGTMSHHPRVRRGQQEYNRRYLYGMTTEQYDALMTAQGDRCAICGSGEWIGKGKRPHVDHDHETNRIRGILCGNCNNGIGMLGEDPARLRAAADYLERALAVTV
jgi:predicted nucleic acid-binding Zn ribbon protein